MSDPASVAPCAPAAVDALAALRAATGVQHDWLDRHLPLSQPGASLHDYLRHVRAIGGWIEGLDHWLSSWDRRHAAATGLALADPARAEAIAADLADFPAPASAVLLSPSATDPVALAFRRCAAGGDSASLRDAFAWGIAYVVEGSQLGGQVLHRRLAAALAPHPLRYLQGRAGATGARWKQWVQALQQAVKTPADSGAACAGAVAAFDALQAEFRRHGVLA